MSNATRLEGPLWRWVFLRHPAETASPQGYWQHWSVAFRGSLGLVLAGLMGILGSSSIHLA